MGAGACGSSVFPLQVASEVDAAAEVGASEEEEAVVSEVSETMSTKGWISRIDMACHFLLFSGLFFLCHPPTMWTTMVFVCSSVAYEQSLLLSLFIFFNLLPAYFFFCITSLKNNTEMI